MAFLDATRHLCAVLLLAGLAACGGGGDPATQDTRPITSASQAAPTEKRALADAPAALSDAQALQYIASYPDLIRAYGLDIQAAKSHYLTYGRAEGRLPSFDADNYLATYPELLRTLGNDPLAATRHYIQVGHAEGRRPSFDALRYIASYGDLIKAFGMDTLQATRHYLSYGLSEGRNLLFDALRYTASYLDLIRAFGSNAAAATAHFIQYGYDEGRTPVFNPQQYLFNYADLYTAFGGNTTDASRHFVVYGAAEGRTDAPPTPNQGFGNKRVLVAHVMFADTVAEPFPVDETVGRTATLQKFFSEISYGMSQQTYTIKPWLRLPQTRAAYQAADPSGARLASTAADLVARTHDLSDTDIVLLLLQSLDLGYPGCFATRYLVPVNGVSTFKSVAVMSGKDSPGETPCSRYASIMAHEVAHLYGWGDNGLGPMLHTSQLSCKTWGDAVMPSTLTDPSYSPGDCGVTGTNATYFPYAAYDVLGGYRGHPNLFQKVRAGWVPASKYTVVSARQSAAIDPLELRTGGIKGLKIPIGPDQNDSEVAYWVEYRSQKPVDLEQPSLNIVGDPDRVKLWVNLQNAYSIASNNVASIGQLRDSSTFDFNDFRTTTAGTSIAPGGVYRDPYRGLRITRRPNTTLAGHAVANVDVELSPLQLTPPVGMNLTTDEFKDIVVTNSGSGAIDQGTAIIQGRHPTRFQIFSDNCSNRSLAPGGRCTLRVTHTRVPGDTATYLAEIQWSSSDAVRSLPTLGLVGKAAP